MTRRGRSHLSSKFEARDCAFGRTALARTTPHGAHSALPSSSAPTGQVCLWAHTKHPVGVDDSVHWAGSSSSTRPQRTSALPAAHPQKWRLSEHEACREGSPHLQLVSIRIRRYSNLREPPRSHSQRHGQAYSWRWPPWPIGRCTKMGARRDKAEPHDGES